MMASFSKLILTVKKKISNVREKKYTYLNTFNVFSFRFEVFLVFWWHLSDKRAVSEIEQRLCIVSCRISQSTIKHFQFGDGFSRRHIFQPLKASICGERMLLNETTSKQTTNLLCTPWEHNHISFPKIPQRKVCICPPCPSTNPTVSPTEIPLL
jgi:hypothetical protein